MFELRKATDRGLANFGWLESKHTFSFGSYYDPMQSGFSDLLVINDDRVKPGKGFDTHGHRDMEIFSYVLSGALAHKDSMGTGSVIYPGDVQMMSAGTGIRHSEFNHSREELVHFLQIWIVPNTKGVTPRYQQQHFSDEEKRGKLRLIISPDGRDNSLSVYQDISVFAGLLHGDDKVTYETDSERYLYVHLARGALSVNGQSMTAGDGMKLRNESTVCFENAENAEVLLFDLRPRELALY